MGFIKFGVSMLSMVGNHATVELLGQEGISRLISDFDTSFDVPKSREITNEEKS